MLVKHVVLIKELSVSLSSLMDELIDSRSELVAPIDQFLDFIKRVVLFLG